MTALIESHYLPSIAYFAALSPCNELLVERHERYVKQSYRNRCYILNAQGREMLTVPVSYSQGDLTTAVKIDYNQKWQNKHWRAIQTAYGNAPFFEFYAERVRNIIFEKHVFLYDLNLQVLSFCLSLLKWTIPIKETLNYEKDPKSAIIDLRDKINAKNATDWQELYRPEPYIQVFGNMFEPNLSLIDLIFCVGPEASGVVSKSYQLK